MRTVISVGITFFISSLKIESSMFWDYCLAIGMGIAVFQDLKELFNN